jgi:predicted O-methyltransferase YrrM
MAGILELRKSVGDAIRKTVRVAEQETRRERNIDVVLAAALQDAGHPIRIDDPVAYVDLLRTCIEPLAFNLVAIKTADDREDVSYRRFAALLDLLQSRTPPLPLPVAIEIARAADRCRSLTTAIDLDRWSGDAGLHFEISSSSGRKGRLLASIIRVCRPERSLELGTAYGMSAMFMMEAFLHIGLAGRLVTIERNEQLFALASQTLQDRYGDKVACHLGETSDILPKLAKTAGPIDFMFHDAGHTGDNYTNDFHSIVDALAAGSVVLFDDIRWEDARFHSAPANAHDGWLNVVDHARVRCAAEVDGKMGLALLG